MASLVAACLLLCADLAPTIALCDTEGRTHQPLAVGDAKAVVLVFTLHDCPIANRYVQELNRIAEAYEDKGVRLYAVLVDPSLSPEGARTHAEEFEYRFPVLLDAEHELVKRAKASKTPEAVVYDRTGRIVYRGRIDDRWVRLGKRKQHPDRLDLRLALDAVLSDREVETPETEVIGCYIPPMKGNR
jgi:peroxiredoxin